MQLKIKDTTLQYFLINVILYIALWAVICHLQYNDPFSFMYLLAEDWWGENATFVAYMAAFFLAATVIIIDRQRRKPGFLLMAAGFFLIAMEEISWGQRLFNIESPYLISKLNYQSEMNLHNMVNVEFIKIFAYILLVWIFVLPVLYTRVKAVHFWINTLGVPIVSAASVSCFLFSLFVILREPLINGEPGELLLSLAFVCYITEIFVNTINDTFNRKLHYIFVMGCVLVFILLATGFFVSISARTAKYNWRMYFSATQSYPKHKLYKQAETLFDYMVNNKEFERHENLLVEYGELLKKTKNPKMNHILHLALERQYKGMNKSLRRQVIIAMQERYGSCWMMKSSRRKNFKKL